MAAQIAQRHERFDAARSKRLEAALAQAMTGEVRFDEGSRALYATDASNYRQVPIGVVIPRSIDDVIETVRLCREHDAPLLSRGGGTSLAGQCCNTAVVIDWSKHLNRVLSLDPEAREAWVEPGCVLDTLREQAERYGLTFGPDPSTHDHNTLGGMIGNNSCGVHSIMGGRTAENVEELEILTYDGTRMRVGATSGDELDAIIARGGRHGEIYGALKALRERYAEDIHRVYPNDLPRRVSGFNLDELLPERGFNVARALVGTEGTCATVLKARVRLLPSPPTRVMVALGYRDVYRAADAVPSVMAHQPIGLEGMDDVLVELMRRQDLHPDKIELLPEGNGWLLAEFGGENEDEAVAKAEALIRALERDTERPEARLFTDPDAQEQLWSIREAGLGATAHPPGEPHAWEGWEDAAVKPERLGRYLREFRSLLDRYHYHTSLYGHFGEGCVHCRINFDLRTESGIASYRRFAEAAADLVLRHEGSLSGEHGDGQSRGELLPKMYGDTLVRAFAEFKRVWDPRNRMNPGKVVDPDPPDANLRLSQDFQDRESANYFSFGQDGNRFTEATMRCVGVGTCRRYDGGVMCPSYMVTREERHSTRGRARLLFEMVRGDALTDGWKSDAVHQALDLCLACKGCKSDCPVNVDMATYKAEFNAHYYQGRLRPRAAYSMGLIYWWSRLAAHVPRVANAVLGAPGLAALAKRIGGVHPARDFPRYASPTFRQWFAQRPPRRGGEPVALWIDTFYNNFYPHVARAAVEVLEHAGYKVLLPPNHVCCGRPLYGWGMLDTARRQLRQVMDTLGPWAARDVPIIGLEPSCAAALRDELPNLFPNDARAKRIQRNTHLLGDFLAARGYAPPPLERKALVHVHCNQHAILGHDGDAEMYRRLGLDFHVLDSGCCGMAGAFGFEQDHYEVSVAAGERVLLPAVRAADSDTLVITNGFSCREQIAQGTQAEALHLAEVLQLSLRG